MEINKSQSFAMKSISDMKELIVLLKFKECLF